MFDRIETILLFWEKCSSDEDRLCEMLEVYTNADLHRPVTANYPRLPKLPPRVRATVRA